MIKSQSVRSVFLLSVLSLGILVIGNIMPSFLSNPFPLLQFNLSLLFFYLVNLIVVVLFFRGEKQRDKKKTIVFTFSAISLKFILYLIFIIGYYLIAKKLTKEFIISFFILYLTFTFFTIWRFLNSLKFKD